MTCAVCRKDVYLQKVIFMKQDIIQAIKGTAKEVLPSNTRVVLFGSRARNDARENSDWDLLIILNKDKRSVSDINDFVCPFIELGIENNAEINPVLYTSKEWENRKFTLFHHNVEKEGIELWH